jgi:hypothetical protein
MIAMSVVLLLMTIMQQRIVEISAGKMTRAAAKPAFSLKGI